MADRENFTNLRSLLGALARAMNLINPDMESHHQQTAYLAYLLAREIGLSGKELERTICAALLHDVGSVMFEEQVSVHELERKAQYISILGAQMLRDIEVVKNVADIIQHCQSSWEDYLSGLGDYEYIDGCEACARIASIIHLADTVSFMINPGQPVLNQSKRICEWVRKERGREFSKEAVDAFLNLAQLEFIWFDIRYNPSFMMIFAGNIRPLTLKQTVEVTKVMTRIIDYRSAFTAMHSAGVSVSAEKLARLAGMPQDDCLMMRIAGNLHDIGKLKVPRAILEKQGKLTEEEYNIIKEHPYDTRLILMDVDGFEKIADWAGYHHEKLNGKGYPFHLDEREMDTGARIMAVADIFSAVAEVRPYQPAKPKDQVYKIMKENVDTGGIDKKIVEMLFDHYDEIDAVRDAVSRAAGKRYFDSIEKEKVPPSLNDF